MASRAATHARCRLPTYFVAQEESDVCARLCCGTARGLTMHVKDVRTGFDAIRVIRPFKCTCFCGVPFLCGDYINPQEINVIIVGAGGMPGPSIGGAKQARVSFFVIIRFA